tara:strand:- start:4550 stop:4813 length:264 start_codon:yes stop_codon:yes gene_type:complete
MNNREFLELIKEIITESERLSELLPYKPNSCNPIRKKSDDFPYSTIDRNYSVTIEFVKFFMTQRKEEREYTDSMIEQVCGIFDIMGQ